MYEILTPVDQLNPGRRDFFLTSVALTGAVAEGEWVELVAGNQVQRCVRAVYRAFPNWTASTRNDVIATRKLTVIDGPHVAKTDKYDAGQTYAVGDALTVNANSVLTPAANGGVGNVPTEPHVAFVEIVPTGGEMVIRVE